MSFNYSKNGLLKVGDTKFKLKYIEYDTFKVKRNVQDLNSHRNTNGKLIRHALDHACITVSFTTLDGLTNTEVEDFMSDIRSAYKDSTEKKLSVTAWCQELNDYITQDCYLVDPEFTIKEINDNIIIYDSIELEFIGY